VIQEFKWEEPLRPREEAQQLAVAVKDLAGTLLLQRRRRGEQIAQLESRFADFPRVKALLVAELKRAESALAEFERGIK
jgi:hypothetical protein